MHLVCVALLASCGAVQAAAIHRRHQAPTQLSVVQYNSNNTASNNTARARAIQAKRQTFLYGPDPDGSNVFFPSGPLGNATAQADLDSLQPEFDAHSRRVTEDEAGVVAFMAVHGGINSIEDYDHLYSSWLWHQSVGDLFDTGMQTNYTQDLLFSMERLSMNPFSMQRLQPKKDNVPFGVDDGIVQKIAGVQLDDLYTSGRLFYINYTDQLSIPTQEGRYAAGCDAYFYIDPHTSDFLPLAIRTNAPGSNGLVYTPLDEPNDWLLAKIAFNENDHWYTAFYHFAATHFKAEIVYEAAIRTLSDDHPILGLLRRSMYQAFSLRPQAAKVLLAPGTGVDKIFASSGHEAALASQRYYDAGAGEFQSNYLETSFTERGLVNCTYGPALKAFPFWEDAFEITSRHRDFITTVVDAYYKDSSAVASDSELQAWLAEAGPAQILNFPEAPLNDKKVLIEMITHMAYLSSVEHHVLNTNDPAGANGQLPFHPGALYSPLPTAKGVKDIMPFLPGTEQSIAQTVFWANFARPEFENTNLTLANMWTEPEMLSRIPQVVANAANDFHGAMLDLSTTIRQRTFDGQGLSQGMPFIWRALDPQTIPFFFAI
jgi:arachidonate 15-lipoxygenase (second type) / 8-lipoxygenase (S-type)